MYRAGEHMELWGLRVVALTLQGKESGRRVRVVQRWGWEEKKKITFIWPYYVLSEKQNNERHWCCLWSLNCVQSLIHLPSQISHKTPFGSVLGANLLNVLAQGRWGGQMKSYYSFQMRNTWALLSYENERGELILIECIYSLISVLLPPEPREHSIWHKNCLIPSTLDL